MAQTPGNVRLSARESGLPRDSVVNVSQIVTLDRSRSADPVGRIGQAKLVNATAFGVGGTPRLGMVDASGASILERGDVEQFRDQVDAWREAEADILDELVLNPPDDAMVPDTAPPSLDTHSDDPDEDEAAT